MDYYYHELEDIKKDFYDTLHDYPLFQEDVDEIFEHDIKEVNDLLDKNDEFYLKKAIRKLKDLIDYIKETNKEIKKEYALFDKYAKEWENSYIDSISQEELTKINSEISKANELIKSHSLKDICEANKKMENVLKRIK